jgi:hypothetical protein
MSHFDSLNSEGRSEATSALRILTQSKLIYHEHISCRSQAQNVLLPAILTDTDPDRDENTGLISAILQADSCHEI